MTWKPRIAWLNHSHLLPLEGGWEEGFFHTRTPRITERFS